MYICFFRQYAVLVLVDIAFLLVHVFMEPYSRAANNTMETVSLTGLAVIPLVLLLLNDPMPDWQYILLSALVLAIVLMLLIYLLIVTFSDEKEEGRVANNNKNEKAEPAEHSEVAVKGEIVT